METTTAPTAAPITEPTAKHALMQIQIERGCTRLDQTMRITLTPFLPESNLWRQVAALFEAWRKDDETKFGCEKIDFVLTFADGQEYRGTFENYSDLARYPGPYTLEAHVGDYLSFYAGRRCPAHWTLEEYRKFLARPYIAERRAECGYWLDHYAIPYTIPERERFNG